MNESDQSRCIVTAEYVVAAANIETNDSEEKPPPYLKLNADCWEHIFDYLSLSDILTMAKTCKRMNQMAGYYMREYYPQYRFRLVNAEIYGDDLCLQTDFYPFISRLYVRWDTKNNVTKFLSNVNSFDALKTIEFSRGELTKTQVESMQNVLKNVERLFVNQCGIVGDIFGQFANHCPKLKQLDVACSRQTDTLFFAHHYPALECCRYWESRPAPVTELKTFFETHSKLKEFYTDIGFLLANRDAFMQSTIELDVLTVHLMGYTNFPFEEFTKLLKELYDRHAYKALSLKLSMLHTGYGHISHAISSLPQLQRLQLWGNSDLDLSRFTDLKELRIHEFYAGTDLEMLAKGLPKLEHFVISSGQIETILPFIRHSKKLITIKIGYLELDNLDLLSLNKERKKLQNACQISIHLDDDAYLHPKWKSHNFKLELDLVKITRYDELDFYSN